MMRIAVAGVLLVSGACTHGPGPNPPPPPPFPSNESKCSVAKSQSEPLVVEWPSASRAKLEALTKKGVVVVAYQGCEMRVLAHCKAPGAYASGDARAPCQRARR